MMHNDFAAVADKTQTYVAYIVPSRDGREYQVLAEAVPHRRWQAMDIPESACAFFFFDSRNHPSFDAVQDRVHISKLYVVADHVLNQAEVLRLMTQGRIARPEDSGQIVWDSRVRQNSHFIKTNLNGIWPVTDNHVVVTRRGEQIFPAVTEPQARRLSAN